MSGTEPEIPMDARRGPAPPGDTDPVKLAQQVARFAETPLVTALLDAMPNGVLILNAARQVVYANRRLRDHIGTAQATEALTRRPGDLWGCRHAGDGQGCGTNPSCNYCGAARATLGALRGEPLATECSITSADDARRIELRVWTTPLTFEGDRFAILVFDDIGEERRRRALEHIFFHDVLNTAGTISGAARLLGNVEPDKLRELERMIVANARRMVDEVEAQRDLLTAEAGELACELSEVDALALLEEQAEAFASHPVARARRLVVDDGAPAVLVTDRRLLGRVVGNMVKNALEASDPGQTVTLRCEFRDGDRVRFAVHNPTHMPQPVQMQVFDRTFSTKGPGRGLGTHSIKLLTEGYLGGEVGFSSEEGAGTVFWVELPITPRSPR